MELPIFLRRFLKGVQKRQPWIYRAARRGSSVLGHLQHPPAYPPGHYYSPIPDLREVRLDRETLFAVPQNLPSLDLGEENQRRNWEAWQSWLSEDPFASEPGGATRYFHPNDAYPLPDALVLRAVMRHLQPRQLVEVGSGYSSAVILDTNERWLAGKVKCTFIDPHPGRLHSLLRPGDETRYELIRQRVQAVDIAVFSRLGPGDILVIDSSHVSKTGSDLNDIVFRILPALPPGVWIHFHDIFYPFEYPEASVMCGSAWNEVYLLRAFLSCNRSYSVQWFTDYLQKRRREWFKTTGSPMLSGVGASLWLRKEREEAPALTTQRP